METTARFLAGSWPWVVALIDLALAAVVSAHVVLYKRDVRAAIGWASLVWLAPLIGAALYGIFGINRIKRRASRLRAGPPVRGPATADSESEAERSLPGAIEFRQRTPKHLVTLSDYVRRVTGKSLAHGNTVRPLVNGDQAYPEMLAAIKGAERSVALCTYIFDNDQAGALFVEALAEAVDRGVEVRVLVDAAGARYSRRPRIIRVLRRKGVPVGEFLRSFLPWRNAYLNLRNHRKILVVDGQVGFTGGLNIREGNLLEMNPSHPVQDTHFRIQGPVVRQLMEAFALDWAFTMDEQLDGERWYPNIEPEGVVSARGILGGPDEDFESIRWTLLGALSRAQEDVRLTTPYFLPDQTLIAGLNLTAMRGVTVDIVVPEVSNLRFVQWAAAAQAWQFLERGCRIWLSSPPFDHSKLMVVDGVWAFLGSANWDPRSLRLNFEYNVECYDWGLAGRLDEIIQDKITQARRLTLEEINGRSLPVKLRDGATRLFSPYL